MLVDDFMELVAMREGVLVACIYLVVAGSKALRLGTTLSDARVVGHSLLFMVGHLRGGSSRPFLALGIVTCVTWEGAGWRGTRVFGVLRRGVLCLNRNFALSLRVRISFRGDLHSQAEVLTRRTVSLPHKRPQYLLQVVNRLPR